MIAARDRLVGAFAAADVRTATTGKLAAPVVHIEPGDPWSEPSQLRGGSGGRRLTRWRLTAIAGRADSDSAFAILGGLIDRIDDALLTIDGAQLPVWAKPTDYLIGNVPYAASIANIQLIE